MSKVLTGLQREAVLHSLAMVVFGEILKRLRQERNLSQQELADLVGVHVRQVSKYEMGTSLPTLDRIRRMAEVLDVSADELVFGSSKRKKASSEAFKNPILAARLRTLEQMATRDELRSVMDLLDAFIAKKQIDQISRGRGSSRNA
ncbi:MAG TPA: helix-turn-helix transcriptional regulator [Gemmatimonadaceae bacterium]|nr:helix-turn-helix transcriptional regulator [Gemmatimonadaceae bacterium]